MLKLKGISKFREKIPKYSGKKIIILPIFCIFIFIISLLIQIYFEILPTLNLVVGGLGYLTVAFPFLGVFLMGSIGIFAVYQMWWHRDRLKSKYGQLSYQKVFFVGFGGVVIIFSIVINNYIPFYLWNLNFWSQLPYSIFITPLTSYFNPISVLFGYIRIILGGFVCVLGLITIFRALETFGVDYMTVIYLYFPEESKIQDNEIFSVLRHPTYGGLLLISLGGLIIQLTLYSFMFYLILYFWMYIHIHFVEEKELITRFGDSYREYRKKTPAFFAHIKDGVLFLKFIIGKE